MLLFSFPQLSCKIAFVLRGSSIGGLCLRLLVLWTSVHYDGVWATGSLAVG